MLECAGFDYIYLLLIAKHGIALLPHMFELSVRLGTENSYLHDADSYGSIWILYRCSRSLITCSVSSQLSSTYPTHHAQHIVIKSMHVLVDILGSLLMRKHNEF